MRRFILVAVALGIPLLWAFVPYGRMAPDLTGVPGEARTFAATLLQAAKEAWHDSLITSLINGDIIETIVFMAGFFGLFTLLYPAVIAMQLLAAPRWLVVRQRWAWIVEGVLVLLLSPFGLFWAVFSVLILVPGAASPPLYPLLWLLPGVAVLAGMAAIMIGIAPRGRIARFILALRSSTPNSDPDDA